MTYTDEAIEKVVQAVTLALNNGGNIRAGVLLGLNAADAAMEAAGFVRVPVEPTKEFIGDAPFVSYVNITRNGRERTYKITITAFPTTEKEG